MISVPQGWACASSPCACVQLGRDDRHFLCNVCAVNSSSIFFEWTPTVLLDSKQAKLMLMQDFSGPEVHQVLVRDASRGRLTYTPCRPEADVLGSVALRLWVPQIVYVAKSLVLRGPRLAARATPALLKAELSGLSVASGAIVQTSLGSYTVTGIELVEGRKGVTLVGAACRVKINNNNNTVAQSKIAGCFSPPVIGLEKQLGKLKAVLLFASQVRSVRAFVVVRGPRGCGVSTVIDAALACSGDEVTVFPWDLDFNATDASQSCSARLCVVRIHPLERYFPAADSDEAQLARCKLESDVHVLCTTAASGDDRSVVVVGSSHQYGSECAASVVEQCFTVHIALTPPDSAARSELIASVRGGAAEEWTEKAHAMVGLSSAEVLDAARDPAWDRPAVFHKVEWADIGGLRAVKECLYKTLILPYRNPELFERFNLTPTKGMLLYGPPGCAKTTLIKALCSESCFSLIYLDSANVISAYVGESERRLRDVFARAAKMAPCIVFFDEVEVLGARRQASSAKSSENVRLLSTLLTELDGFAPTRGVCFIGATNVPHLIDPALLRPGRFDYLLRVPLPGAEDRCDILRTSLRNTAVDIPLLASRTEGFSGADLKAFCAGVLLELLRGGDASLAALQDKELITSLFQDKLKSFNFTTYDLSALVAFEKEHRLA